MKQLSEAKSIRLFLIPVVIGLGLVLGMVKVAGASQARPVDSSPADAWRLSEGSLDLAGTDPGLRLLQADHEGVTLELATPEYQVEQATADGQPCQIIRVDGYGSTDVSGLPQVPLSGALVGIPPQSKPALTILQAESVLANVRYNLCPVSRPVVDGQFTRKLEFKGEIRSRDPQAYAVDAFAPKNPAELVMTGYVRSQRVAQVRFQPFQYNPVSGELRYYRTIRLRLDYPVDQEMPRSASGYVDEGAFESLLRDNLVNYAIARQWRSQPLSSALRPADSVALDQATYKLMVDQDGLYQVTYTDLQAAGANLSGIDPNTFRLFNQGVEVATLLLGNGDTTFEPGESLLFYGQKIDTRDSGTNVYILSWGGANGRRMPALDGAPSGLADIPANFQDEKHLEENLQYFSDTPSGPDNNVWYWDYIYAVSGQASVSFLTTLSNISTSPSLTATVRGFFKGYSAIPEHHTRIYLNGHLIDDHKWSPRAEYFFEVKVPQTYLVEGENKIIVRCPKDGGIQQDIVLVDWFEIDYWKNYIAQNDRLDFSGEVTSTLKTWEYRVTGFTTNHLEVFDITDPITPVQALNPSIQLIGGKYQLAFEQTIMENHRYLAQSQANRLGPKSIILDSPSNLKDPDNRADYIIITHPDFLEAVLPLSAWRATQGLSTTVVNVVDIYDEFSYGITNTQAIHDFLAYAYANWQPPAPMYVLLVGDGHFDPRNYWGENDPFYILPYMVQVDPWIGETAAENRFVAVSGSDNLPDMYLGRLPVRASDQAVAMVNKIIGYEQTPSLDDWSKNVLYMADNADEAGNFALMSNSIAGQLPPSFGAQKIYWKLPPYTDLSTTQAAIIDAINQGYWMVNYIGHASMTDWAGEALFGISSVASLNNSGRLPFMVPMTCMEGSFQYPNTPDYDNTALAEVIVLAEDRGAIASWSPTGFGVAAGHEYLDKGLYEALFHRSLTQLGPATTYAKLYLFSHSGGAHQELIDTYALFGDPATWLGPTDTLFFPFINN